MNKFAMIVVALLALTTTTSAKEYSAPAKDKAKVVYTDTTTSDTYKIKDEVYPVFKTKSNARYIWKTSKKGNKYKYYLPKEVQIEMGRQYNK